MDKFDSYMGVYPYMSSLYQDIDIWIKNTLHRMTRLAARIFNAPIALITLLDNGRLLLASDTGLEFRDRDIVLSGEARTLQNDHLLVVPDTRQTPSFVELPLAEGRPDFRFYAGLPLISSAGTKLGTLAVMDYAPREPDQYQTEAFGLLGQQVAEQLELGHIRPALHSQSKEQEETNAALLHIADHIARAGGWTIDLIRNQVAMSDDLCTLLEFDSRPTPALEDVYSLFPPESRQHVSAAIEQCAQHGEPIQHEAEMHTATGKLLNVFLIGHAVRDEGNNIVRIVGALQDITEKKQKEQISAESEQRFHQFADTMPQIIWTAKCDGTVDYANHALSEYAGVSIEGKTPEYFCLDLLHPDDKATCVRRWREAVETGRDLSLECRIRCKDGKYRWHLVNAVPTRDESGKILKWHGTSTDIQDRKAAEERANRLAARLTATLESITDALFILDHEWRFTYLNHEAERLLQRSRNDLLGKVIWEEFKEAVGTTFENEYRRALQENATVTFEEFYPPLGLWLEARAYPSAEGLTVYFRDISESKRAREAIRESEERFKNVARVTADAIWDWDLVSDAIWWNEGMLALFGYPPNEIEPDSRSWTNRIHADDKERVLRSIHEAIESRCDTWKGEYRFLRKDGTYAYVLDRGLIIRDRSGTAIRMVGGMSDLTARKNAEFSLARVNRSLQMLSACNEALIRGSDEMQLLGQICRIAVEIGGFRMAAVGYAQNDSGRSIKPVARAGIENAKNYLDENNVTWRTDDRSGLGPAGRAIRSGAPAICEDIEKDPTFSPWVATARRNGYRSLITLPLRNGDHTFGVLALFSVEVRTVTKEEIKRLQELADNLAFGIVNLRSQDERRRIEAAVLKVAAGVSASSGTEFFQQLSLNMAEALDAQAGFVARFLPGEPLIARTVAAVVDGKVIQNFDYAIKDTPCERFLKEVVCIVPDNAIERFPNACGLKAFGAKAYAGWRLGNSAGQAVGLLYVLFREPIGQLEFVTSTMQIFAARAAVELERQDADARIRNQASLLDKAQDAIIVCGTDHRILFWNKGAERLYGWTQDEALGKIKSELLHSNLSTTDAASQVLQSGDWSGEIVQHRKDGQLVTVQAHWTLVRDDDGNPQSILAINTDITQRKAAEHEVQHLAFYDTLTRLPNRRMLLARLQQALAISTRNRHTGALLFIDLDNFKALNDTLGHDTGDMLLQQVALRLSSCVRKSNTVARLGGDEFLVMLEDLGDNPREAAAHAGIVGEKILAAFNQPFQLGGYHYHTSPSIGITLFHGELNTVDDLLKRADLAMYQAKAAGRNTMRFFDPEMQEIITARVALEADLRQGLQHNEFLLYYQPQADSHGRMTGTEALVRWHHPSRGSVPPSEFIPLAEETGLIGRLGEWVLETACSQLATWQAELGWEQMSMAVNVSARQFRHPEFVQQVLSVLDRTGANPHNLKLELTESLLVDDVDIIIDKMSALKARGIGFSLDDFGTGYSSLAYLKRLPLDQLKIDQSFVNDVLDDPNDAAIARTIVALGQSLGLSVIAEGVETEAQRDFLASYGCNAYQGYLYSRPLPSDQFEAFVSSHGAAMHH